MSAVRPIMSRLAGAAGMLILAAAAPGSADARMSHAAGAHGRHDRRESIDVRIRSLHDELKITPEEEKPWGEVAETMRWNEAAMQKLVADTRIERRSARSALDDLKTYEAFNRAHLEGLKQLITSFETLYAAMPDTQKALADQVFKHFGRSSVRRTA